MKCPHCGEELPEGFIYIHRKQEEEAQNQIGISQDAENTEQLQEQASDITTSANALYPTAEPSMSEKLTPITGEATAKIQHNRRVAGIIAAAAIVIAGAFIGFNIHGSSSLRAKMTGTWASAGNMMTTGKLTITEDTIAYSETFVFMEMNGQTVPYKAVSKDTIEIQGIKHKISFDASDSTMTITPGITTNGAEVWYSTSMQSIPGQSDEHQNGRDTRGEADADGIL